MNQTPYLFIVGCARSGTTLLQRMLDHHPLLAVANEARLMNGIAENGASATDPPLTADDIEQVRTHHRSSQLGLSDAAISEAGAKFSTYGEFASYLYAEYGKSRGKLLVGEKTPQYVRFLPRLHAIFPWVRTIHLIRDGRDVALSIMEWARAGKGPGRFRLWQQEPVAVCALLWNQQVMSGRTGSAELDSERYHEVTYEELVKRPEPTLRTITEFLKLPFATEMLTYHEGRVRQGPGISAKKAWLPPTRGLRDWRTQMPARETELFEAIAGDLLSTLGYERAVNTISREIAALSEQCRNSWNAEMTQRRAKRADRLRAKINQSAERFADEIILKPPQPA